MNKITPFLWLDGNAEQAAQFYMSIFAGARKINELRSSGVGPWPKGELAAITIELMGQAVTLFNGGPQHSLSEAFSLWINCKDQAEIDRYWSALTQVVARRSPAAGSRTNLAFAGRSCPRTFWNS